MDIFTGLLWDSTPTAGSHGLFNSRDNASALAPPDLTVVASSMRSIRAGTYREPQDIISLLQTMNICPAIYNMTTNTAKSSSSNTT